MGNESIMDVQLNVSSFGAFVGITLKPDMTIIHNQCGTNLTLLGLHKQVPTANIITTNSWCNHKSHEFYAEFKVGANC